jgi:uncharacterized cupin superfamily protein
MAQPRRHPNVVNVAEVDGQPMGNGKRFSAIAKRLGAATAGLGLGCSSYEVEPGKTAFPRHFHCANEEALFVLDGEGTLRIGGESVPVRAGDYVTLPTGPAAVHQLVNTGTAALRYLAISTMLTAEVVGYPDSKKIGAWASPSVEAALRGERWVRLIAEESSGVGYYDGEQE